VGLQTSERLPADTFVLAYIGELIGETEMARRDALRREHRQRHSYAMRVDEVMGADTLTTIIDPTVRVSRRRRPLAEWCGQGNVARFVNHSCAPNMRRVLCRYEHAAARVAFFTTRAVDVGEELTYFYDNRPMRDEGGGEATECRCGAPECRGRMPNDELHIL